MRLIVKSIINNTLYVAAYFHLFYLQLRICFVVIFAISFIEFTSLPVLIYHFDIIIRLLSKDLQFVLMCNDTQQILV